MKITKVIRGNFFHYLDQSTLKTPVFSYIKNGALIIENGIIKDLKPFNEIDIEPSYKIIDYGDKLIIPGFIDTHTHYPQVDVIASYGEQLLEWLEKYTFPTEVTLKNKKTSKDIAKFFIKEMLKNGTTTAMVFSTVHSEATKIFFKEALKRNLRVISGKVNMDRNAPPELLENYDDMTINTKKLIKKWSNKKRLSYALTPRFAPTSTEKQLAFLGDIYKNNNNLYVQTHLSENKDEVLWIKELFKESKSYLDVYKYFNLVGGKSVFAHCIHLEDEDFQVLKDNGSAISFCPSSNLFLGSGLFNYARAKELEIPIGIGSDIGAGTSFSILRNLGDAYKICQLNKTSFSPLEAFYCATLGGAKALSLDTKIGNFEKGKEADFIVIDICATKLMRRRASSLQEISELLFLLMTLGGEENITATYIMGKKLYSRKGGIK